MLMSLAEMFLLEVLVRSVRVPESRMSVLVLMGSAVVFEATGMMAVVVGHVEVLMGVHQLLVVVLLRFPHLWTFVPFGSEWASLVAVVPLASSF